VIDIECVWPAEALLGEAPYWHAEEEAVYWVDIDGRKVFRYDPCSGRRHVVEQDHEVGCLVPRKGGGFIAGIDAGLAWINSDLMVADVFASPEKDNPRTRFNDGKCDRRGRFWVASADRNETEAIAALYVVDVSGEITKVMSDVIVGNGMGWSPDNRTMYFTETGRGTIHAFDYDIETGTIGNQQVFATVPEAKGYPDGLTVDADGFVWSAHWSGWRVTRYTPDGLIDQEILLPVPCVTSLTFGGDSLDRLFITTARIGLNDQQLKEAPLSGGLFAVDVGIQGISETEFAG